MVVGFVVRNTLLIGRYGIKALGFIVEALGIFVRIGSWIGSFLRSKIIYLGSTVMSLAFWIALFAGIFIGAVCIG